MAKKRRVEDYINSPLLSGENSYLIQAERLIKLKKPGKAAKFYEAAAREYAKIADSLNKRADISNRQGNREDYETYRGAREYALQRAEQMKRNAERLESVKTGVWHGLSGRVMLIIGILCFLLL
jgi:hypothetical protein